MDDYDEVYSDGRGEGYYEGYRDGHNAGYAEGYEENAAASWEDGYVEGKVFAQQAAEEEVRNNLLKYLRTPGYESGSLRVDLETFLPPAQVEAVLQTVVKHLEEL